jgi:DNA polymerase-3 subunit delta
VSALSLRALGEELGAGRIRPAYLLAGAEALLRDDALALLRRHVLAGAADDFDFERLEGASATPAQLHDALRALPVVAPRRLVVLREPEPARRGSGPAARELAEALPGLVAELAGQASCVLATTAARIDRRARWPKAFAEVGAEVACDAPRTGREIAAFAREEARRQGAELDAAAADLLAERVGPQLLLLRNEIAKAALLAAPDARITREHVAAAVSDVAEQPIWDLTDAIGEGQPALALGVLARVLSGGAPPPVVGGALAAHFRKLARLRSGASVGGPPFVIRKLESQARRYAPARLVSCLRAIHDADLALKGAGAGSPELALERLVLGLSS